MSNGQPEQPKGQQQEQEQKKPAEQPQPERKEKQKKSMSLNMQVLRDTLLNYIVPLISVSAAVLIGVFVLYPSYKELPELQMELEQQTKLETVLSNKLNNLNRLVDFEGIVEENSDLVNKVLVSEGLVPGLLTQIDRIARDSGLTVNRLNYGLRSTTPTAVGEEQISGEYSVVTVNMDAVGSFAQLKTFMDSIENAARIVLVDNFRYSLNTSGDETRIGVSFVLESPYLFVESNAITDDPVDLDISDPEFLNLINKIKSLKYYDPYEIDLSVPVEEAPAESEEPPAEGEAAPTPDEQPTEEAPTQETVPEDEGSLFP